MAIDHDSNELNLGVQNDLQILKQTNAIIWMASSPHSIWAI